MFHRFAFVRTVISAGMVAGIALSLPLWRTRLSYPQVPVLDVIPALPQPIDVVFLLAFLAVLGICMWQIRYKRLAVIWLCAAAFLVVQDQSRFQPWFLEYSLLFAVVVFSRSETSALVGCRLIVVAVYFWSGLHKMNTSFAAKGFPKTWPPYSNNCLDGSIGQAGTGSRMRRSFADSSCGTILSQEIQHANREVSARSREHLCSTGASPRLGSDASASRHFEYRHHGSE
jgi:hypothetical protein